MPNRPAGWIVALVTFAASPALTLADDRGPTADERSRIEVVLREAGFTGWEEIEFDDGGWEVDDARGDDGREYDLRLDADTFEIRSRDADG